MILLGVTGTAIVVYSHTDEADVLRHAPLWWVLRRAEIGSSSQPNTALTELWWRVRQHELSPSQVRSTVDRILQWQTKPKSPWDVHCWGFMVNALNYSRDMTDEQAGRFLTQDYIQRYSLAVRSRVRAGAVLPFGLTRPQGLFPTSVSIRPYHAKLMIDGQHAALDRNLMSDPDHSGDQLDDAVVVPADILTSLQLPLGDHTATLQLDLEFLVQGAVARKCSGSVTFTAKWQLVNEPTVKLYQDTNPLKRMWMVSLLLDDVDVFVCPTSADGSSPPYKESTRDIRIPVPIAADVVIRADGRDTVAGSLVLRKGAKTRELEAIPWPKAANAVVVLRPNPELAERTTDLFEILGDEISPPRGK
jgi:hypothetical protein